MQFIDGLDHDLKHSVLCQLRDLWTYTSTGLEGNSLTLGDTQFVLEQGLTVSGKPIKDHQEVVGHAKAIDLIYGLIGKAVTPEDCFALHKAVQTELVSDIYKPYGAWKLESNGTYAVKDGKQTFIEYASPNAVPSLMSEWLYWLNKQIGSTKTLDQAVTTYTKAHLGFVHIHPFWDGNGRLARLLANLPVLAAGLPPIVIARESRKLYLELLASYQLEAGQLTSVTGVWPDNANQQLFVDFVHTQYANTQQLITAAFDQQKKRGLQGG